MLILIVDPNTKNKYIDRRAQVLRVETVVKLMLACNGQLK